MLPDSLNTDAALSNKKKKKKEAQMHPVFVFPLSLSPVAADMYLNLLDKSKAKALVENPPPPPPHNYLKPCKFWHICPPFYFYLQISTPNYKGKFSPHKNL